MFNSIKYRYLNIIWSSQSLQYNLEQTYMAMAGLLETLANLISL